ncbi:MAG: hypothetical protein KKB59_18705 [Spirochaetes bacterium]|nr:hypothetical protein [Spirochaetota bacterium]
MSVYGQGRALAAAVREALTGESQVLVWYVDLRAQWGEPDHPDDVEDYQDQRWQHMLTRAGAALRAYEGLDPVQTTDLYLIVVCEAGSGRDGPSPVAVQVQTNQRCVLSHLSSTPPPAGRWLVMSEREARDTTGSVEFPASYFADGLPF